MSNESDGSGKTAKAQQAKPADPKAAPAPAAEKEAEPLALEDRRYSFEELKRGAAQLAPDVLVGMLNDGRAHVRANAVLGLAATGHALPAMVPLLRDSEAVVANAAADAFVKLGRELRPVIPQIVLALDGTQFEVTQKVVAALADQI